MQKSTTQIMSNVRIQPVGLAHIEILAQLHRQCFRDAWTPQTFAELLNGAGSFALLAVAADGLPAGFALARVTVGEGEILTIGVLPRRREKGIGRALLAGLVGQLVRTGGHCLFLEVAESNRPARRLYESSGFQAVGRRPKYYTDVLGKPEAAIIMRRDLAG